MRLGRFGRAWPVVAGPAVMVLLAACGGREEAEQPERPEQPQQSASAAATTPVPSPPASATQGPGRPDPVEVEVADPEALAQVEASIQALNAERESLDPNEYLNRANDLTAQAAAAYGTKGLGVFSCQLSVGIVSGAQGAAPAAVRTGLGNTLKVVVRNATGNLNQTLAGADVDGLMRKTCPDVRTAALEATGVTSLNQL